MRWEQNCFWSVFYAMQFLWLFWGLDGQELRKASKIPNCDQNKKGFVSCMLETKGNSISLDDKKEMCIPKVFENTSFVSYNYVPSK